MNIYIISPNPIWGGAATANISIAKVLAVEHQVFYNDEYNKTDIDNVMYDDYPVHHLKDSKKLVEYLISKNIDVVVWGIAMNIPYYYKATKKLQNIGIKQLLIFHSLCIGKSLKSRLMEYLIAKQLTYIDHLVFVSQFTDVSWSKYKSVCKHPSHNVIYNPIELGKVNTACEKTNNRIGFVGRFSPEKQPEIFARLSIEDTRNEYIAWGDGPLLSELKKKYNNVVFKGQSSNQDEIYNSFDILVMTSEFENCPMVILEALKYGIPCVAPNVGGIPEIVKDGYNGVLYDSYTEDEIKSCISKIQDNYEDFSLNCLAHVHSYSFDALFEEWNALIKL